VKPILPSAAKYISRCPPPDHSKQRRSAAELVVHLSAVRIRFYPRPNFTEPRSPGRGIVLVVVLVLVVMLALAGFGFLASMSTEYEAAKLNTLNLQARQTMDSAEEFLMWFSALPPYRQQQLGGWHNNQSLFRGHLLEHPNQSGSQETSDAADVLSENSQLKWRFAVTSVEHRDQQGRVMRFGLRNESARLNLTDLLKWDQQSPGTGRAAFMRLPQMTEAIADALLDWIDADEQPREFGAESDFYLQLDRPYQCANSIPNCLEELLFVRGITDRLLLGGTLSTGNSINETDQLNSLNTSEATFDPAELSEGGEQSVVGWSEYLTVRSGERNTDRMGRPRVNLNMANLAQLNARLSAFLPPETVRFILLARVHGLSVPAVSGIRPSEAPYDATKPPTFAFQSPVSLIDASVRLDGPGGPVTVAGPLKHDEPDFADLLTLIMDRTTITEQEWIPGRININEATAIVLAAVPGITPELVSQITAMRDSDAASDRDTTWLLRENLMDTLTFQNISQYITSGGSVFQADITVFRGTGGPVLRRNVIIDGASAGGRRVHWRDTDSSDLPAPINLLMPSISESAVSEEDVSVQETLFKP
jgi:type II secretory pathway component PulK